MGEATIGIDAASTAWRAPAATAVAMVAERKGDSDRYDHSHGRDGLSHGGVGGERAAAQCVTAEGAVGADSCWVRGRRRFSR